MSKKKKRSPKEVIESVLNEVNRVLKKGGEFRFGKALLATVVEDGELFTKEETETFDGTDGNYELQYITTEDEQGTIPGVIVFKDEIIKQDWVIP